VYAGCDNHRQHNVIIVAANYKFVSGDDGKVELQQRICWSYSSIFSGNTSIFVAWILLGEAQPP
jgi:hypothetical protein